MGDPTGTFDFERHEAPEDIVVRTIDGHDEQRWIDLLVTPSGRVGLWNFSPSFEDAGEAIEWAKTTMIA